MRLSLALFGALEQTFGDSPFSVEHISSGEDQMTQVGLRGFDMGPLFSSTGYSRRITDFHKGQTVFLTGEHSDFIYFIEYGRAKLTFVSTEGREAVLAIRGRGEFFGEELLSNIESQRQTNVIALSQMRTTSLDREAMFELLRIDPNFSNWVTSSLAHLVAKANQHLAECLLCSSEQRLMRTLIALSKLGRDESRSIAHVTQQDLANMIGITRQRVNGLLKSFKEQGFIEYSGGLQVHGSIHLARKKIAPSYPG